MADAVYTRSRAKDSENSVAQNGSGGISGPRILTFFFFSKFLEKLFVSWDDGTVFDFPLHFDACQFRNYSTSPPIKNIT